MLFIHTCYNEQFFLHFPDDAKSSCTVVERFEYSRQWQVAMETLNFLQEVILDLSRNNTLNIQCQTYHHHGAGILFHLGQWIRTSPLQLSNFPESRICDGIFHLSDQ